MDKVRYIYGTKEAYLALDSHDSTAIYFCTDTRELYKGDQRYGDGVRVVASYASLPTVKTAASGVLYVCKDTGCGYVLKTSADGWNEVLHGVDDETIALDSEGRASVKAVPMAKVTGLAAELKRIEDALGESGGTTIDTGATAVKVQGAGNAVTDASYNASSRTMTLEKNTKFATADELSEEGKSLRAYVDEKTKGISTDASLADLQNRMGAAEADIDALESVMYEADTYIRTVDPDNTVTGVVYAKNFPDGTNLGGYVTYEKNVASGEKYFVTTRVPDNKNYAVALFYNETGYMDGVGFNDTAAVMNVTDYEVTIPDGCTLLRCSAQTSVTFTLKQEITERTLLNPVEELRKVQKPIAYRLANNTIEVCSKYGVDKDQKILLSPKGGNGLFDFYRFALLENTSPAPSTNFDGYTVYLSNTTDWHAPFQVSAVDGADGDNVKTDGNYRLYFTGGNHQYNNTGSGSTATARLGSLRFFVDGKEITAGEGYANTVEMRWTNYVQGYNTTKADGSGREILQENHTLRFDGVEWTSDVELIALEEINIAVWYGFQGVLGSQSNPLVYLKSVRYVGSKNRGIFSPTGDAGFASSCGSETCNKVICHGDEHCMEIEVDETYDLGKRAYTNPYSACFTTTSRKVYHSIVHNDKMPSIPAGDHYYLRGKYRFYPM